METIPYVSNGRFMIATNRDVLELMKPVWKGLTKQDQQRKNLWLLGLDLNHSLILFKLIAQGELHRNTVDPLSIFTPALMHGCHNLILVHNSTEGDLQPTDQEIILTEYLQMEAALRGLQVIDP